MADKQHHPNEAPKRHEPVTDEEETRRMVEDDDDLEEDEPLIIPDESDEGVPRERD